MQLNVWWKNYQAVNDIIKVLIDQKLENCKKSLNFYKSLRRLSCKLMTVETIIMQLMALLTR